MVEIRKPGNPFYQPEYTLPIPTKPGNPLYRPANTPPPVDTPPPVVKGGKEGLDQEIQNNPELKNLFDKTIENLTNQSPETKFNINRIIMLLIELCRALQDAAVVMSTRLEKSTDRLTGYSQYLTQVPVVTQGQVIFTPGGDDQGDKDKLKNEADARALNNQKFANMLDAVRANKGLDEDRAKKIQTIMQSMKDANASSSDFITSFIDLLRGISSKLFR